MAKVTEELPLSPFTLYLKEARIVKFKYKPDTMDYLYVRSNSYSPVGQPDYYVKYNLGNPDLIPFPFNEFYLANLIYISWLLVRMQNLPFTFCIKFPGS